MSILTSLFGRREQKVADAGALTYTQLLMGGGASKTGLAVDAAAALRVSTVFGCCRVIAEDVGKLPLKLMKESSSGAKEVAKKHPLHRILSRRPNEWQTSMEWRMTMLLHALVGKAGYSFINRSPRTGEVLELIPMMPGTVTAKQTADWTVYYEWKDPKSGAVTRIPRDQVHVLHGLSWDGINGLETIAQGKEAIGLSLAAEETQARLHGQGARPGGVLSTPNKLGELEVANLKASFAEGYAGVSNAFKTLLLDNGLEFKPWQMNGVDGQHLQTRKHQVEEICRFFRVFPSMIGYSDKATTYGSAEAFFGAHVVHSLLPWIVLWEQAMERDLLTEQEQNDGLYPKFFFEGLLRGSAEQRAQFYESAITRGCWMSRNEARRLEDLNPISGLDEMLRPMNMQAGDAPKPPAKPGSAPPNADPAADPDDEDVPTDDDE